MNIAIIMPSGDMVHTDFAMSLNLLTTHSAMTTNHNIAMINPRCSLVQKGRWQGVKDAMNYNFDKVLFIDSDQTFPAYALQRLLSHSKKIVCTTSHLRNDTGDYTARDTKGNRIDFSKREGLHEVVSTGFHFALIDIEVFRKVPEPWFNVEFNNGIWISEDETFFRAARSAGYKVWVDADLTQRIGHIGIKEY